MATKIRGSVDIIAGTITNTEIASAAAIAYSKLNLSGSIVNGDIVSVVWSKITSTPTTLAGYGITDAVTGTGTTGKLPKWSATSALTDSVVVESSSNIGIGLTPTSRLTLPAGSATANTAPLQFTSGTLETTPRAGVVEFLTDAFYGTITTGPTRHTFATEQRNNSFSGFNAFGGTAVNTNNIITAARNLTDPAADSMGAYFSRTLVMTANNSFVVTGFYCNVSVSANAFNQTGVLQGGHAQVLHGGSGTVTNAYGVDTLVYNTSTGTITNAVSANLKGYNLNAAGIITNLYGAAFSLDLNGGTITNTYGFYVGDITLGTQTNTPFSFYASDAGAFNYFAGRTGIGVTAPTAMVHLKAGTATASTAPLKFTSGTNLTTAEAGALEFTTDDYFATITTGAARKAFVLDDGARLTSGKIPIATTNGRLIDGQTPLSGAKVYYVSDTSGGAVTRKLTFTNGILTAET